jgi:hypothetical protein
MGGEELAETAKVARGGVGGRVRMRLFAELQEVRLWQA